MAAWMNGVNVILGYDKLDKKKSIALF